MEDHFPALVWAHLCQAPSSWISHLTLPGEAPTLVRRSRQIPAKVVALHQEFISLVCVTNSLSDLLNGGKKPFPTSKSNTISW